MTPTDHTPDQPDDRTPDQGVYPPDSSTLGHSRGSSDLPAPPLAGDEARLAEATKSLRGHVDDRWVQVADRVLLRALAATRRSLPVRAADEGPDQGRPGGRLFVSEQTLTAYIRDAIAGVPAAAPNRIHIHADTDHRCTGVSIEITVSFGEPIIPIADEMRGLTETVLGQILGPVIPPVTVSTMHVHVSDVTTDDPHTGRPRPDRSRGSQS